jgi:hypothetical protein
MPTLTEMFSDAETPTARGDRLEGLKKDLQASIDRHDRKEDAFVPVQRQGDANARFGIIKGAGPGAPRRASVAQWDAFADKLNGLAKGLSADDAATVMAELGAMNALRDELSKDISTTVPGNLHPYDLEAPAKRLVPRFTPLRNEIPREKGIGTAREYRRILGYTNSGMGGVADVTPFFNSETGLNGGSTASYPAFGALTLIRGQKISYAMDVHTVPYMEMSLSAVTGWKAQFANMGFENSRQLDQMALLWGHLLGEEKAILFARGGSPYAGAVAAPSGTPTLASGGGSGSGFGTTVFVKVTSYTGQGESLPSTEGTNAALTAGQQLVITLPGGPVAGALLYGVYTSATTNTETFQGFFPLTSGGTNNGKIVVPVSVAGGRVVPAADASFNANAYDGLITTLISGGSGPSGASGYTAYFPTVYGPLSGSNPVSVYNSASGAVSVGDKPWQDMFASLYASVYADPEEVWLSAVQRRQLADFVRNNGSGAAAYRITMGNDEFGGGVHVGGYVTGLANESSPTDRLVALRVHPYMPSGVSFARSRTINVPDSGIGDSSVVAEVQGYMSVDWPEIQFTYDSSTYWFGTLLHYAPAWSGIIYGLQ